ncbi:MAG: DUF1289 domain-containing protein [Thiolinea sp.]
MRRKNIVRKLPDTSVPSPCIGVCWLDDKTRLCEGCLRSADEIRDWMIMDKAEKLALLQELEQRRISLDAAPGN